jgi:regulator of protease activity HflC (stomatin/prohibitin superfamily)
MPILITLGIAAIALVLANIRIVPQASEIVIERLGKFQTVWDAGLHVKVPLIDRMANRVLLKEQILDTPPQNVITSDNVTMQIDAVVYYRVNDAELYTYGTARPVDALANLTTTTLRNIIGDMSLDQTLTSRDTVNSKMAAILDKETDPWGIKVIRVELRNIIPPPDIREAMEKQMRAEREKREKILLAEGQKQSVILVAEGEKQSAILQAEADKQMAILRAEGQAESLRQMKQAEADSIRMVKEAEAQGLKMINEASPSESALKLRYYDSLVRLH